MTAIVIVLGGDELSGANQHDQPASRHSPGDSLAPLARDWSFLPTRAVRRDRCLQRLYNADTYWTRGQT